MARLKSSMIDSSLTRTAGLILGHANTWGTSIVFPGTICFLSFHYLLGNDEAVMGQRWTLIPVPTHTFQTYFLTHRIACFSHKYQVLLQHLGNQHTLNIIERFRHQVQISDPQTLTSGRQSWGSFSKELSSIRTCSGFSMVSSQSLSLLDSFFFELKELDPSQLFPILCFRFSFLLKYTGNVLE